MAVKKTTKKATKSTGNSKIAKLEQRIAALEAKIGAGGQRAQAPRPQPTPRPRPQMAQGASRPTPPAGRPQMPGMGQRGAPMASPRPMTPRMPS
tara:strand:+ start:661 stop:942 length:282 start_codon:yes stop_codon:yes gene_type:complete